MRPRSGTERTLLRFEPKPDTTKVAWPYNPRVHRSVLVVFKFLPIPQIIHMWTGSIEPPKELKECMTS